MPSIREMRLRIRSIKNISQVTRALETVSASYVRKAIQAVNASQPYADKAWKVLLHIAGQPGHESLHPLLKERSGSNAVLVLVVSGDRGLAGAYNVNVIRETMRYFADFSQQVDYISVGRKGREMLLRRHKKLVAEFSHLPSPPKFIDVSPIGRLIVDDYLDGKYDQVYIVYTQFVNMIRQEVKIRKLLPFDVSEEASQRAETGGTNNNHSVFSYEPDQTELLDQIIPRFTALQVFHSILSSQASEHAARMVAMRSATDNARELLSNLQLEYNKARQQSITNDILDIAGGAEALAQSSAGES
ncbi:MAG: ATP synthase F1 subunit gamma [Anaerolineaceae bacterium]|nr:ATP synthase F1 subunit gamma [Anaerolineaceae bacterium]